MSVWDDQPAPEQDKEITDLETARLALRGALQSSRNLQDLNGRLKGELQDYLHREKALNERLIRLQTDLNEAYARLDQEIAKVRDMDQHTREQLRQEIVAEQNHKWQGEIDALRQSVQNWTEVRRQKEIELRILKETVLAKEQEVFTLQKEKISSEEKSHIELVEAIRRSREGVAQAIDEAVKVKEREISDLQRKLAEQPQIIEKRLQQVEQDLHRKEQALLLQFRERQQALELDWTHREKDLWEKTTESREKLEDELKRQWEDRRKKLEDNFAQRHGSLEAQMRQQEQELSSRLLSREEELHQTWAAKEGLLAKEWASREQELAHEFQKTLDQERQHASEEVNRLKAETENWRHSHAERLRDMEAQLRATFRKREEDVLARHQQALEQAQYQVSDLLGRVSEREGQAKAADDRLAVVQKDRDALLQKLQRAQEDSRRRQIELETLVQARDQELARLNQVSTTRDEEKENRLQGLERENLQKISEIKVLRDRIGQAEADRQAALEQMAALQTEFATRQQALEQAFRVETVALRERLNDVSQKSSEQQQVDHRRLVELDTDLQQRQAQILSLEQQLKVSRTDIEDITRNASSRDAEALKVRHDLQEQFDLREQRLLQQIDTLEKERLNLEERLQSRVVELERDLARRVSEDRVLQDKLTQTELFRADLEKQAESLRDRLAAHESHSQAREEELRSEKESAQKDRIAAEHELRLKIGELDAEIARLNALAAGLQTELAQRQKEFETLSVAAEQREHRHQTRNAALEERLKEQEKEFHGRLASILGERDDQDTKLRKQIETLEGQAIRVDAELHKRELSISSLQTQLKEVETARQALLETAAVLEARVLDREQALRDITQKHVEVDHHFESTITSLQGDVQRRDADLKAAEKRFQELTRDRQVNLDVAATREKQFQERIDQLDEKLRNQKEQMSMRLASLERERLQNEEALHIKALDLEQRLAQKSGLAKTLQERITRLEADKEALDKKVGNLESHLSRTEQQLKGKEVEYQVLLGNTQKESAGTQETHQRKLLDLQAQRLAIENDLKNSQSELAIANADKKRLIEQQTFLEKQLREQAKAAQAQLDTLLQDRVKTEEGHQKRILELEASLADRIAAVQALENRLATGEGQKTDLTKQTQALQKEIQSLQAQITEQSDLHRAQMRDQAKDAQAQLDALIKDRLATEELHQKKILELDAALAGRTAAAQALENRLATSDSQRADLAKETAALQKEIQALQAQISDQQDQHRTRIANYEREQTQIIETQKVRIAQLESQVTQRDGSIQSLEGKLHQLKQEQQELSHSAQINLSAADQGRQSVEEHLAKERGRLRDLESQLRAHSARIKELEAQDGASREAARSALARVEELQNKLLELEAGRGVRENDLSVLRERSVHAEAEKQRLDDLVIQLAREKDDQEQYYRSQQAQLEAREQDSQKKQDDLRKQILELQETVAARVARIALVENQLADTRQQREALEKLSNDSHSDMAQKNNLLQKQLAAEHQQLMATRTELEQKLNTEREQVRALTTQMAAQTSELQQLRTSLTETRTEREKLVQTLAGERDTITALHARIREVQDTLAARQTDLDRVTLKLQEAEQSRTTLEELSSISHAELVKQQAALQAEIRTLKQSESDKVIALQRLQESLTRTETQRAYAQEQWDGEKKERLSLQDALAKARTEFAEQMSSVQKTHQDTEDRLQKELLEMRATLEKQVNLEREQGRVLNTQVGAQVSEIQQLKDSLADTRAERERLLQTLAVERETAAAQLKQTEKMSAEQRKKLEQRLAAQEKEFRERLALSDSESAAKLQALQIRVTELQRLMGGRENEFADQLATARKEHQAVEDQLQKQLLDMRTQLEQQLNLEREQGRSQSVILSAQLSELEQLRASLTEVRTERERVVAELTGERQKAVQEMKQLAQASLEQKKTYEMRLVNQEKEFRERAQANESEAVQKVRQLQARIIEMDKVLTAQRAGYENQLHDLQTRMAAQQSEVEQLQSTLTQAGVERENLIKTIDQAREQALLQRGEVETVYEGRIQKLHQQLRELERQATERADAVRQLEQKVLDGQHVRESLEQLSTAAHAEWMQQRQGLEAQIAELEERANRTRLAMEEQLKQARGENSHQQMTLTAQISEMEALRHDLQELQKEREELLKTLAAERQSSTTLEKDLRVMALAAEKEAAKRLMALQSRLNEMEKARYQETGELQKQMQVERETSHGLQTQLAAQTSELEQLKVSLAQLRTERESLLKTLAEEREGAAGRLYQHDQQSAERLRQLQARVVSLDKETAEQRAQLEKTKAALLATESQLTHAQEQWTLEKKAKNEFADRLSALQKEHQVSEDALEKRLLDMRRDLDLQLQGERDKGSSMQTQLASQISEISQLKSALDELRAERERLLQALAAEREQASINFKQAETSAYEQKKALEGSLLNQEKEFRSRLAAADAEAAQKRLSLQNRIRELEQRLGAQENEFAAQMSVIRKDHHLAERQLQQQLLTMRAELEKQLQQEHEAGQSLNTQMAAQVSELDQLRVSLTEARAERERLLATLAAEREQAAAQLRQAEKTTVEQRAALQMKMAELEKEFSTKLSERDLLASRQLQAIQQQAAEIERTLNKQREQLQVQFAEKEKTLHSRVLELQDALASRQAELRRVELKLQEAEQAQATLEQLSTASHADLMSQQTALRQTILDLEKQLSDKQTALDRLQSSVTALESRQVQTQKEKEDFAQRLAQAQSDAQALEKKFIAQRAEIERGSQKALAQARQDFDAQMALVRKNHLEAENELQSRLQQVQTQFEQQLQSERSQGHSLNTRLTEQVSELERLRVALEQQRAERESLLASLAAEREKAVRELKSQDDGWRVRLNQAEAAADQRLQEMQERLAGLEALRRTERAEQDSQLIQVNASARSREKEFEKRLTALRQELEEQLRGERQEGSDLQLRINAAILETEQLKADLAQVRAERAQLAEQSEKERVRFDQEARQYEARLGTQDKTFRERLSVLEKDSAQRLQQAQARVAELEKASAQQRLDQERQSRQALDQARQEFEQQLSLVRKNHLAAEDDLQKRLQDIHHGFEQQLQAERSQNHSLNARLSEQVTELERLRAALASEQLEREHALASLAAERERVTQEMSLQGLSTGEQKKKFEERLAVKEAEFQQRLVVVEAESAQRIQRLESQISGLEKSVQEERNQRRVVEQDLRQQTVRVTDLQAALKAMEKEKQDMVARLAAVQTGREQAEENLREQLVRLQHELDQKMQGEHKRSRNIEEQSTAQGAELKQLRQALADIKSERAQLLTTLAAERDRAAGEQKDYRARLLAVETESAQKLSDLQDKASQLERQLQTQREETDQKQKHLQEAVSEKTRLAERVRTLEKQVEQQSEDLQARLAAFERDRGASQSDLHRRLVHAQEQLTRKGIEVQELEHYREEAKNIQVMLEESERERSVLQKRLSGIERDFDAQRKHPSKDQSGDLQRLQNRIHDLEREIQNKEADWSKKLEQRVAERLREQMLGAVQSGQANPADSAAMQTLLEEWVFGFAHQVRNPLGIIRSVAESLLESISRTSERDSLGAIVKAVDGLNIRLKEFIEFSKPVKPLIRSIDLPAAVSAAIRLAEEKGMPAGVKVQSTLPAPGTQIHMDPDHLRTILVQLVRNAAESMPKGGRVNVTVSYEASRENLEIAVEDQGPGIPREHMKEIGRPFFSTKPGAVGLGLALIKRLLRAYDGKLDIETKPGRGTTMRCRMKLRHEEAGRWAA